MIDNLPLAMVAILCVVAFAAGWIDAVVGGGGVLQLPALLIVLPPDTPVATLSGTNKLSSVAGTAVAARTYASRVAIPWATALLAVGTAFAGSSLGARLVQYVPREWFTPVIAVVVAAIGMYTVRRPTLGQTTVLKHTGSAHYAITAALGLVVGVWDGLVGPGTGVFLVIGFVALLGYGFLEATTMTKLANLATNIAALLVLGVSGHVLWALGGCMAVCNFAGGAIGSRMAIRFGNRFIRGVFLIALIAIEVMLIYDIVA